MIQYISILFVSLFLLFACSAQQESGGSSLSYTLYDEVSKDLVLDTIQSTDLVVIVNKNTNITTLIEDQSVIDQWPSVTADVTGEWHIVRGAPETQNTPDGIFVFDELQHCPVWYPSELLHKDTGEYVDPDSKIYWDIINTKQDVYGPCGPNNPLGDYIAWFQGPYGFHGTTINSEWMLFQESSDHRRLSGGCIRNPRDKIQVFFEKMLNKLRLFEFYQKVRKNRVVVRDYHAVQGYFLQDNDHLEAPQTLTQNVSDILDAKIIIGHFKKDLPLYITDHTKKTVQLKTDYICEISGAVPIYRNKTFDTVVGSYSKGDRVVLLYYAPDTREPVQTNRGWVKQYYVENCKPHRNYWEKIEISY